MTRTVGPLTSEEAHALHYVAGYVCRKVKLHLDSTSKCDMSACLHEVVACDDDDDEWINLIDQGGLYHINNSMYRIFVMIEEEIREQLTYEAVGVHAAAESL